MQIFEGNYVNRYFKHIKTGNIYKLLSIAVDCTNNSISETKYAVYCDADAEDYTETFVRKWDEFSMKFKEV